MKKKVPKKPVKKKKPVKRLLNRIAGKVDKLKKKSNTYTVKPDRYSVTFNVGAPAYYEDPNLLSAEVDGYFEYIKGEYVDTEVEIKLLSGRKKKGIERVWIRDPEPATVTGLCLYLGFASLQTLSEYEKKGGKFGEIIKRGKTRVANRYERNLSGDKPTGSIFALKNMGWKDNNFIDPGLGEDVEVIAFNYIIPAKPKNDD